MTRNLDLDDIQGNVIRAYGKFGYPKARYFFLTLTNAWVGREFTRRVIDRITTARRWPVDPHTGQRNGPPITMNIGYTFMGFYMMELPTRTLQSMPDDWIDGMKKRAFILGDKPTDNIDRPQQPIKPGENPEWMNKWDGIWRENRSRIPSEDVHIWVSMNAKVQPGTEDPFPGQSSDNILEEWTTWLDEICQSVTQDYRDAHGGDDRGMIYLLTLGGRDPATGAQVGPKYQEASAVFEKVYCPDGMIAPGLPCPNDDQICLMPTPCEHFGLADGIGDPVFEGQFDDETMKEKVIGRGKWMDPSRGEDGWEPLATGEFLLGHPDESQELPPAARPPEFTTNGTFMAFRKLHQNVLSWRSYFAEEAKKYSKVAGIPEDQAEITLRSKVVGRWPDGVPMSKAPKWDDWQKVRDHFGLNPTSDQDKALAAEAEKLGAKFIKLWWAEVGYLRTRHASDFKYAQDMQGFDCPNSSHLRRVNTRDYLDPQNNMHPELVDGPDAVKPAEAGLPRDPSRYTGVNKDADSSLNKRRRILRRGLPYGSTTKEAGLNDTDETDQGVAMMILCANLFRQFEFVQQQWIEYGLDFNSGNNTCPLVGSHETHNRFTVPADPKGEEAPYVCSGMKTFVEIRGGEYFFIPSITALNMIAHGVVDPT